MLLQAYDFVHLYDKYGCELQVGGSDQWGNITAGIDLARRMRGVQLYGMTCPLLTKSDGSKMGKTEQGHVWLSAERTSPYQFYQYWINVDDADVGQCLRMLTELPREEIEALDAARAEDAAARDSQTSPGRGADAAGSRRRRARRGPASDGDFLRRGDRRFGRCPTRPDLRRCAEPDGCPQSCLSTDGGLPIVDALVAAGLAKSKGEARRTVEQGGAYVNNRRIAGVDARLTAADLASESVMVLRTGKKKYALLRFE